MGMSAVGGLITALVILACISFVFGSTYGITSLSGNMTKVFCNLPDYSQPAYNGSALGCSSVITAGSQCRFQNGTYYTCAKYRENAFGIPTGFGFYLGDAFSVIGEKLQSVINILKLVFVPTASLPATLAQHMGLYLNYFLVIIYSTIVICAIVVFKPMGGG